MSEQFLNGTPARAEIMCVKNVIGGSGIFLEGVTGNPSERRKRALRGSGLTGE